MKNDYLLIALGLRAWPESYLSYMCMVNKIDEHILFYNPRVSFDFVELVWYALHAALKNILMCASCQNKNDDEVCVYKKLIIIFVIGFCKDRKQFLF